MNKMALLDLSRQRSLCIAAVLAVFFVVITVGVNIFGGVFALLFDGAILVAGIVLLLTCDVITLPPFFRVKHAPLPFQESGAEGGRLEVTDGVPVLSLAGINRRMGRQAGILLKDQIHLLVRDFLDFIFRNPKRRETAMGKARLLEKHIPAPYLEELRGISETSGVPYGELLLANTFMEDYRVFLCSTLIVRGGASAAGKLIMGRNLDFVSAGVLHHYNMMAIYHPAEGYPFAAVTLPGIIGVVSGMNIHGLSSAMLISFNGDFSSEHIPSTIAFRMLLERCRTVDEATAFLEANRIAGPFNLALADSAGNMRVAELAHNHFATREPVSDVLTCTNRFQMGRYSGTPADHRTRRLCNFTRKRSERFDEEAVRRALCEVYLPFLNLQSMVFLPEKRLLHLSAGTMPAAKGRYTRIDLAERFRRKP